LPELATLDGDEGARGLLRRHGAHEVVCDDPGVLRDVDTVDDLAGANRL
jgi:molybdenum cofactor cytidylyltransferase